MEDLTDDIIILILSGEKGNLPSDAGFIITPTNPTNFRINTAYVVISFLSFFPLYPVYVNSPTIGVYNTIGSGFVSDD